MPVRPKLFLTFAALCISPLLILSLINFRSGMLDAEALLRKNLEAEVSGVAHRYASLVAERERELTAIARGPLPGYVRSAGTPEAMALINSAPGSIADGAAAAAAYATREAIANLPPYYTSIACFDPGKRLIFLIQPTGHEAPIFRTKDFLPGVVEPDNGVWDREPGSVPRCSIFSDPQFGDLRRCSVLAFLTSEPNATSPRAVLVADMSLSTLFRETELPGGFIPENTQLDRRVIVLNSAGKIVYHDNDAFRNQLASSAMPEFAQIARSMIASRDGGLGEYRSLEAETWKVGYQPVDVSGLYLAVARNYTSAAGPARRAGWLGIALSILFGSAAATLLSFLYQRKTGSLEQVKQRVAAIAKGETDQQLLLRSSDDLRPLADSVNVVGDRLREQLAREAEAHQFQSFIKLAALLTHDLKNAIAGLSLMISNMEGNFDNPQFRADSMKGLTSAADKLRRLVARLSNPVNTMSGEFKLPRPTDLVPLVQRVREQIADPLIDRHEIEVRLPPSLMAMADGERIEKVMENLVLNAVEAMAGEPGKLTIEAGQDMGGKVFFSVSDTGEGMSPEFVQQRLFRPFATTKSGGVGLGLYTCREVVRANGGTIEVESTKGSGTTFRVVLASAPIKKRD